MGDALRVTPWLWFAAASPVLLLFVLVARGRGPRVAAVLTLVATVLVAAVVFAMRADGIAVGLGKGLWLGLWILLVVWPALLMYQIVAAVGFERIGDALSALLPDRTVRLLVVAWLFPSFVQGVAGFGTPVAVAAPLLVAMGWSRTRSVALALVGYHWSVTFGSMGSSFYVASLTAGFDHADQVELAIRASTFLAVNCLVAGALVLLMDGGRARLREGAPVLLRLGVPMAAALVGVAAVVPAVASLVAGSVGFAVLYLTTLRRRARTASPAATDAVLAAVGGPAPPATPPPATAPSGDAPCGDAPSGRPRAGRPPAPPPLPGRPPGGHGRSTALLLCPYLLLLVTALPVFVLPWSRAWVKGHLRVAPHFPDTGTGRGWMVPRAEEFNPVALFGLPGCYLLIGCLAGYAVYRRTGLLDRSRGRGIVVRWARGLPAASVMIVCLTSVAMVMSDSGMISVLAQGTASLTGDLFPALSPFVGALGSFMTGSTTSSNALLAAFQGQVATLLDVDPQIMVAAQTAGGNVGNSLAPVVVLIGLSAVGGQGRMSAVLRMCLWPALALLATLVGAVLLCLLIS